MNQLHDGDLERWVYANGALSGLGDPFAAGRYVGAVALARAGLTAAEMPIDWLHTQLAQAPRRTVGKPAQMALAVGGVVLLLAVAVGLHYRAAASDVAFLEAQLAEMGEDVAAARLVIERVDMAENWYGNRTSILHCLEGLTAAFGDDAGIWATDFALQENLTGSVAGAANDGRRVLEVRDRLQASPLFDNVALMYMREPERRTAAATELAWAISFEYRPGAALTAADASPEDGR